MSDALDPYRPPRAPLVAPQAVPAALFSPGQIAGVTFLFSAVAGWWLLARNFVALGRRGSERITLACGVATGAAFLALGYALPEVAFGGTITLLETLVVFGVASAIQGRAFEEHLAGGGARRSTWIALAHGLGSLAALLFAGVLTFLVLVTLFPGLVPDE